MPSSSTPPRLPPIARSKALHSKLDPNARGSILVRRGMIEKRHSMRTIAEATGLFASTVSRIFNGQRTGNVQTLVKIAAHLGVTLDALNAYLITQRPKHKR